MTFAVKLQKALDDRGWSVGRLAAESGVPYTTLKSYFQKRRDTSKLPSYSTALSICKVLGVEAGYFADCDDVKEKMKHRRKKGSD